MSFAFSPDPAPCPDITEPNGSRVPTAQTLDAALFPDDADFPCRPILKLFAMSSGRENMLIDKTARN